MRGALGVSPTPDPQHSAPVLWRGPWTEPAPILTRGSAFVFVEEASRAVASALPFTDLAQLDILGNVPDYIRPHGHVLTSGRYVGAKAAEDDTKTLALQDLMQRGEKVYAANCVACHQASGKGTPPVFPALDGSPVVNGPRQAQIDIVLNGKPNTPMAAFGGQLNDVELAAVITFTRNNWGNRIGDQVLPAEVKALRK